MPQHVIGSVFFANGISPGVRYQFIQFLISNYTFLTYLLIDYINCMLFLHHMFFNQQSLCKSVDNRWLRHSNHPQEKEGGPKKTKKKKKEKRRNTSLHSPARSPPAGPPSLPPPLLPRPSPPLLPPPSDPPVEIFFLL